MIIATRGSRDLFQTAALALNKLNFAIRHYLFVGNISCMVMELLMHASCKEKWASHRQQWKGAFSYYYTHPPPRPWAIWTDNLTSQLKGFSPLCFLNTITLSLWTEQFVELFSTVLHLNITPNPGSISHYWLWAILETLPILSEICLFKSQHVSFKYKYANWQPACLLTLVSMFAKMSQRPSVYSR